jgi:uncharacterized membrane protein YecN with MAPEG domain
MYPIRKIQKINSNVIFLGLILLSGIIITSYGVFNNIQAALYSGLSITILGSIYGILRFAIYGSADTSR